MRNNEIKDLEIEKARLGVLELCDNIEKRVSNVLNNNTDSATDKILRKLLDMSLIIKENCEVDKFTLYFNGEVGVGKSTAISLLLNLIDEEKLKEENKINDITLLKTAAGRTTICETRIIPNSSESYFEIEGIEIADFKSYLKEFVDALYGDKTTISREAKRAIKNMANLKGSSHEEMKSEIVKILKEKDTDNILGILESRVNYEIRNKKILSYNESEGSFIKWLKKSFANINDGKIEDIPMPSMIKIFICEKDLDLKIPNFIKEIADTKGMESEYRDDIDDYMRKKDSISIMCDRVERFGAADNILANITRCVKDDEEVKKRVIIMGLERGKELSNVVENSTREEGIKIKYDDMKATLKNKKIDFDNIKFLNSMQGIRLMDDEIARVDLSEIDMNRLSFYKEIWGLLNDMYSSYRVELLSILKSIEAFTNKKITNEDKEKFNQLLVAVEKIAAIAEKENSNRMSKFSSNILKYNAAALMGCVNHKGEGEKENVYSTFRISSYDDFKEHCGVHKAEILALLDEIFKDSSKIGEVCSECIRNEVIRLYLNIGEELGVKHKQLLEDALLNYESWRFKEKGVCWGDKGGHYRVRVWNLISKEIESKDVNQKIECLNIESEFYKKLIKFLSI